MFPFLNSVLEGRCPAEFSSNLAQNTCLKVSSMLVLAVSGVFDKGWSRTLQDTSSPGPSFETYVLKKRLGYVRNPRSLMEGMEALCRDDIHLS